MRKGTSDIGHPAHPGLTIDIVIVAVYVAKNVNKYLPLGTEEIEVSKTYQVAKHED